MCGGDMGSMSLGIKVTKSNYIFSKMDHWQKGWQGHYVQDILQRNGSIKLLNTLNIFGKGKITNDTGFEVRIWGIFA